MNAYEINDLNIPFELRAKHYDILVISSREDADKANKLKDILKKFIAIKDKSGNVVGPVEVATLHDSVEFDEVSNIHKKLDIAMENSNYYFVFLTKFSKEDEFFDFKYECIINSCITEADKKWSFIPVLESDDFVLPRYCRSFEGISLRKLFKGQNFDDIDVDTVDKTAVNLNYIKRIEKLVSEKYSIRLKKQSGIQDKCKQYLEEQVVTREKTKLIQEIRRQTQLVKLKELRNTKEKHDVHLKNINFIEELSNRNDPQSEGVTPNSSVSTTVNIFVYSQIDSSSLQNDSMQTEEDDFTLEEESEVENVAVENESSNVACTNTFAPNLPIEISSASNNILQSRGILVGPSVGNKSVLKVKPHCVVHPFPVSREDNDELMSNLSNTSKPVRERRGSLNSI